MPKKIEEAEVKKECPSCGLGVSLDSTMCEFCGWDFNEEDEWILQIEKLERDLMLEKQKFEPGSVNEKIESTLHSPATEMKQDARLAPKTAVQETQVAPRQSPTPKRAPAPEPIRAAPAPTPVTEKPAPAKPPVPKTIAPAPKPVVEKAPEPVPKEAPAPKARLMRVVKSAPSQERVDEGATTRRKLVRKVKGRS